MLWGWCLNGGGESERKQMEENTIQSKARVYSEVRVVACMGAADDPVLEMDQVEEASSEVERCGERR